MQSNFMPSSIALSGRISPAKRLNAFDKDFAMGRVGVAENLHHFGNVVS
jgi:hypothetical protein